MTLHLRADWHKAEHSRWLKWIIGILAVVLVVEYVVLPQLVGSGNVISALRGLPVILILLAVLLETASLASYSWLTREVLAGDTRPGFFTLFRIDLADLTVNHTVPGGGTTSAAVRFRLLTRCGVQSEDALSAATIQVVGANLVLAGLFGAALLAVHGSFAGDRYLSTAGAVVLVLLGLSLAALTVLDKHLPGAVRTVRAIAGKVRIISPSSAEQFVRTVAAEVRMFREEPRRLAAAVVLAALRYLLDAACLWVFLAAYGYVSSPAELMLAYSLASLVALAPLTPGGLGLVEGVLVPMLAGFGAPSHVAVLGVLSWRLVQFWLPIPVGALAYLSLRLGILRRTQKRPRNSGSGAASVASGRS